MQFTPNMPYVIRQQEEYGHQDTRTPTLVASSVVVNEN